ncbi:Sugar (and other) transporter [Ancistrocladus abbreviatus]
MNALKQIVENELVEEGEIGKGSIFTKVKNAWGNRVFRRGIYTGYIVCMAFVDRYGRRRLMIISLFGIIICLAVLAIVFYLAATHAPQISYYESTHFGMNATCPTSKHRILGLGIA